MVHGEFAQLAAVTGAAGTMIVVLLRDRLALLTGFALLAVGEAMLAGALVPGSDLERFRRPLAIAAVLIAVVAVVLAAAVFARRPEFVLPALLVAAPFRLPIRLGDQRAFLLIPLYAVLAAASIGFLFRWLRGAEIPAIPRMLAVPLAVFIAFDAVSLLWSEDVRQGSIEIAFFLLPFAAGLAVAARAPLPPWLPRALGVTIVALASLFAVVGIWQAATHRVFFAQDLRVANAYTSFFRVTSLFKDSSLYGRYLVFGFAVIAAALWLRQMSPVVLAALAVLLFVGLYFSYSQSSLVTLVCVLVAVTLVAGDRTARRVVALTAVAALAVGVVILAAYASEHSSRRVTSGRSRLVSITTRVIADHPLTGVGVGGQPRASHNETARRGLDSRDASHTTPLTVAAELGIGGVILYLALLIGAAGILYETWLRNYALGLVLAAIFFALFTHSLFYAGFFEDPMTIGTLAVAAAAVSAQRRTAEDVVPAPREAPAPASKVAAPAR